LLASSAPNITSQELKTADGQPSSLITLDTYSVSAFEAFHLCSEELYEAVKALQKGVHCGTVGDFAQIAVIDAEAPGSDSEGEEEDEPALSYCSYFFGFMRTFCPKIYVRSFVRTFLELVDIWSVMRTESGPKG
jgi:hypothetical protein